MNTLVQPDPGLYIWTIVTFLVLVAALAKFAWRPLLEALERRQERSASRSTMRRRPSRSWKAARRVAAHPGRGAHRGRTDPLEHAVGRQSVPRGTEAEGAGRSCGHREERRAADRARDRARLQQIRTRSGRHLGGDCLQAARSGTCRKRTTSGSSKKRSSRSRPGGPS